MAVAGSGMTAETIAAMSTPLATISVSSLVKKIFQPLWTLVADAIDAPFMSDLRSRQATGLHQSDGDSMVVR
ncbi:hypothetical protein UK99_12300 [Frankia casuarinae]|nr:hypothetical protein Manayef4_16070 [Frankia sp. CgIM4]OHV52873.1 hypothetical protein CgIS1_15775 [Frankia sp. CgIS1]ORT95612.1 hypothetical protein UK99_12300 [Frankia casuarinae]